MSRFSALCGLLLSGACASGSSYGTAVTGTHSATGKVAAGAVGVAATGATGTSGSGTGTAGASSGGASSTGSSCPASPCATLDGCGPSQTELCAQLVDFLTGAVLQFPIEYQDLDNPGAAAASNDCGTVVLCTAPGDLISPYFFANSYLPSIVDDLRLEHSESFSGAPLAAVVAFNMITSDLTPPLSVDLAAVAIKVLIENSQSSDCPKAGWTFALLGPDGGAVDASVAYFGSLAFTQGPTATGDQGTALLYDIDPAWGEVTLVGAWDGGPGVAASCGYAGELHQFLPSAHVQAGALSVVYFDVAVTCGPGSPAGGDLYAPCEVGGIDSGTCVPYADPAPGAAGLCVPGARPDWSQPAACIQFDTSEGTTCPPATFCYTDYLGDGGSQCQPLCGVEPVEGSAGPGCDAGELCVQWLDNPFGSCAPTCATSRDCPAAESCIAVGEPFADGGSAWACEP